MKRVVLDASITVGSCIGEKEVADVADSVLDLLFTGCAVVPGIWLSEVANVLVSKERTKNPEYNLKPEEVTAFLGLVGRLPVVVNWASQHDTFGRVTALARSTGLTVYDAQYLDLAQRLALPLGSLDGDLCAAARTAGVKILTKEFLDSWQETDA